jgi:peptide chain release factor subunit 1
MIGQEDLQDLLAFDAGDATVVSLYLNADNSQQSTEIIKLQARALLKESECPDEDASAIEHYLELSHEWGSPGLALFSCAGKGFFRAIPSAVAFRNRVRLSARPHLKPLTHLMDHYAHYGVVLVDRVGARFFEYHLGELQETAGTAGEDVRKLKLGGGSSRGGTATATGQRGGQTGRHEEETAQRNLREAAAAAQRFFAGRPIRRLFLAGTAANVAQFRDYLNKQLQSRVAGTFALDMTSGEHEVRARSLELLQKANTLREQQLVRQMITTASKGGNAVLGLADTLRTVSEGRVETLVLSDGYRAQGYVNNRTAYLSVHEHELVPLGHGNDVRAVTDVVEAAVSRTIEQGGHVEIISDSTELDNAGRIGALLRY